MRSLADSSCLMLLPAETIFPSSDRHCCYPPRQKQASLMHWAETTVIHKADLQADQMSLPWGLPSLLKVQGKADGRGWQQLQPTTSCCKSIRSQKRTHLYSLMILLARFHSSSKQVPIKLFNFPLPPVISLSHFPISTPFATSTLRWGCLEQKAFIPNGDSLLDTRWHNWRDLKEVKEDMQCRQSYILT